MCLAKCLKINFRTLGVSGGEWSMAFYIFYKFSACDTRTTYSVFCAAGHDVLELDFWHVVVVDSSQVLH